MNQTFLYAAALLSVLCAASSFTAVPLLASAQYQASAYSAPNYSQQRKMAPTPQTYGHQQQQQQASYGAAASADAYEPSGYSSGGSSRAAPMSQSYEERQQPASSYGRQQQAPAYGAKQGFSGYGAGQQQAAAASYAKPAAPKYEEPYVSRS